MKLKCNHARRVLVLPSGNTVHRSDGSQCHEKLTIGGNKVTKIYGTDGSSIELVVSKSKPYPAAKLLTEIFEG